MPWWRSKPLKIKKKKKKKRCMSDIGSENAWSESQQMTNGIVWIKIDRAIALDFAVQAVVIRLQTDRNSTGG